GRTFPNIKVFIDGRTEVYGAQFFKTYQKVWQSGNKKIFDELARKHRITGALLNDAHQQVPSKVVRLFYGLNNWKLVYFDYDALIFLKNTPENQLVIARHAIDLAKWRPPRMDLQRLGPKRIYPFPHIDRARVLIMLKLDGPARKELNEALKIAPEAAEIYQLLGDIEARRKEYRKAFEHFRVAVMLNSGDHRSRLRLAWAYERLKDYPNALKAYERLLADKPKDAKIAEKVRKLKERLRKQAHA
ncbi:MAG: tetratricopeptide repeat protein, partial [Candidatus Omnitrophica bacterium]|nr:tetratricopeptide repeat protein [Candidatus Omnitrophota bacterium]